MEDSKLTSAKPLPPATIQAIEASMKSIQQTQFPAAWEPFMMAGMTMHRVSEIAGTFADIPCDVEPIWSTRLMFFYQGETYRGMYIIRPRFCGSLQLPGQEGDYGWIPEILIVGVQNQQFGYQIFKMSKVLIDITS